jgi:hypothetical protein
MSQGTKMSRYFPLQQQHPPQSSPLQQHFSQQQLSPQQSQHGSAAMPCGLAFAGLRTNGNTARTMDDSFMSQRLGAQAA